MDKLINEVEQSFDKIDKDIEEITESVNEIEFFQNELKELLNITSLKNLLLEIDKKIIKHSKSSYLFNSYLSLRYLLESSYTLNPLFISVDKIKNKDKILLQATNKEVFNKELKKACNKLRKNKFSFKENLSHIYDILLIYLTENEAKVFIYSLCRLINSNGNKFISTYSLFINQLMKNITLLNEGFDYKDDLLESIEMYYKEINN